MGAHAMSVEDVRKTVRGYYVVFGALLFLTAVTVGVSYLDFSTPMAIAVALFVAGIKGSLVALYFMHLIDERKIIYATLGLTAVLFGFLMTIGFY